MVGKKARAGDGQQRSNRRKKCEALTVRLLPAQKVELEDKAAIVGMKVTSYARHVLLTDRPIASSRVNQVALAELSKVSYRLNKIGVLINQIARVCNATGQILSPDEFFELVGYLKAASDKAGGLIRRLSNLDEEDKDAS
ncbi:MAG: plasmid mobilization relaxosome protein MobC [Alphaproteobacteria bacterium]|nr:plasmid mobilization relaxosome protein MobC [Alphaproteobacteria bacterium]